jgi:hypothetical protein
MILNKKHTALIVLTSLGLLVVMYMYFTLINADYSPLRRWGDCGDEGFWVHNARLKVLFGGNGTDEFNQATMGAPLFNYITYLVFKTMGISITKARVASLVCFVLVCVSLFVVLIKTFRLSKCLLYVLLLSTLHEVLMYALWGTPLFFEILFYVLLLLVYEYKHALHPWLTPVVIALCMYGAITSKLTSIYFVLPLGMFLGSEYFIKKQFPTKFLITLIISFACVGTLLLVFFYIPNYDAFVFFYKSVATTNVHVSAKFIVQQVIKAPVNLSAFMYPSMAIMFMVVLFRGVTLITTYKFNIITIVKTITTLELYSWCWIIGSLVSLIFTGEIGYDRRMIHLYIPITLVAFVYINDCFVSVKSTTFNTNKLMLRSLVAVVLTGYCGFYLIATVRYRMWFAQVGIDKSIVVYMLLLLFSAVLCGAFVFITNRKTVAYIVLAFVISANVFLNYTWINNCTYTVQNTNLQLQELNTTATYITGPCAHLMCINNSKLIPLWYRTQNMGTVPINNWFTNYAKAHNYIWINLNVCAGNKNQFENNQSSDYFFYLQHAQIGASNIRALFPVTLANYAYTKGNSYRYSAMLYEVSNSD